MPQRAATIESLPTAFEMVKVMQAEGLEWREGYRPLGRRRPSPSLPLRVWQRMALEGS